MRNFNFSDCINEAHIYFGIIRGNRPDVEEIIEECPKEIIDLMKQCWEQKAEDRPTFAGKALHGIIFVLCPLIVCSAANVNSFLLILN